MLSATIPGFPVLCFREVHPRYPVGLCRLLVHELWSKIMAASPISFDSSLQPLPCAQFLFSWRRLSPESWDACYAAVLESLLAVAVAQGGGRGVAALHRHV